MFQTDLTVHHQESWYCIHSKWYLSCYLCRLSARWEIVHLVGFYYTNISWYMVLRMSKLKEQC